MYLAQISGVTSLLMAVADPIVGTISGLTDAIVGIISGLTAW
jgi:hypothetical protein